MTSTIDEYSKRRAEPFTRLFVKVKAEQLAAVRLEKRTRRQALDTMQKKYVALRAEYLKIIGTTYQGWLDHGPAKHWDEITFALRDDAVWDRLVETFRG